MKTQHQINIDNEKFISTLCMGVKPNTHGGARKGSGRKSKPPTATISFRVPEYMSKELHSLVGAYIKSEVIKYYENRK